MAIPTGELQVITKTYDFAVWTCNHIAGFNRSFRYSLGERLERQVNCVLEGLIRARYDSANRLSILRQVNVELELLRFQFRLAMDLKCLAPKHGGFAARCMLEIGEKVGGWIKTTSARQGNS